MIIQVLQPGFQTTVQDLGRPGWAHLGVSAAGAADPLSLRLGNRLCGNPEGAPALELTLVGGEFVFESAAVVALAGADFGAVLDGQPAPRWTSFPVRAGQLLRLGPARDGARGYLCVRGGLEVPLVLGSASTHLLTALGGLDGRALRRGDSIRAGRPAELGPFRPRRLLPAAVAALRAVAAPLRVLPGPQADWFPSAVLARLVESAYRVREDSDRMGLRLAGPALALPEGRELVTEGVPLGAVQVPRDGQPIILFVEHRTTGGYPKIATVAAADAHRIGQLRPRDEIRFERVTRTRALELLQTQEDLMSPRWMVPA